MRQIYQLQKVIEQKIVKEYSLQAALHGKKTQQNLEPLKITAEERKEYDTEALGLLERLKREHQDGSRITD